MITNEELKNYRHGMGLQRYYQDLRQRREALDSAFTERAQAQKLAAIGAAVELSRLEENRARSGFAPCTDDDCDCSFCQRSAALESVVKRGLSQVEQKQQQLQQQKLASDSGYNAKLSAPAVHRRPRWDLKASH